VTLFAAGGSQTSAHLVPCSPRGLRLAGIRDHLACHLVMLNEVYERVDEFDVATVYCYQQIAPTRMGNDSSQKSPTGRTVRRSSRLGDRAGTAH
jgi:hypothetical protein